MAIVFDAITAAPYAGNPTTFAHTVGVGDDRILLVSVFYWDNADAITLNGITYAGAAMTPVTGCDQRAVNKTQEVYYLVGPAEGINNVVVTWSGATGARMEAVSYRGINIADPIGDIQLDTSLCNVNNTVQVTVASEEGNLVTAFGNATHTDCLAVFDIIAVIERNESCHVAGDSYYAGEGDSAGVAATVVGTHLNTALAGRAVYITGIELIQAVQLLSRPVEYTFDVWDPLQRVMGKDGHEVAPNEIRANRWGKLLGFRSPSSKVFASLADSTDAFYISGVTSNGEDARITPDEQLFADMILKRLTR